MYIYPKFFGEVLCKVSKGGRQYLVKYKKMLEYLIKVQPTNNKIKLIQKYSEISHNIRPSFNLIGINYSILHTGSRNVNISVSNEWELRELLKITDNSIFIGYTYTEGNFKKFSKMRHSLEFWYIQNATDCEGLENMEHDLYFDYIENRNSRF